MMKPSSPIATKWFESMDLMYADIVLAQVVIVAALQVDDAVLETGQ